MIKNNKQYLNKLMEKDFNKWLIEHKKYCQNCFGEEGQFIEEDLQESETSIIYDIPIMIKCLNCGWSARTLEDLEEYELSWKAELLEKNQKQGRKFEKEIKNWLCENNIYNLDMTYSHTNGISKYYKNYTQKFFNGDKLILLVGKPGCPDFCVKIKGEYIFIETKTGSSQLNKNQLKMKEFIEKIGYKYWIIKTITQLKEKISKEWH